MKRTKRAQDASPYVAMTNEETYEILGVAFATAFFLMGLK